MTVSATPSDRLERAVDDPRTVVSAPNLLADFNDCGVLSPIDVHAAVAAARLCEEVDPQVMLAAALAVRGARLGNVCIRLDDQRESVTADDGDREAQEKMGDLPWPDPDEWLEAVKHSRLFGGADDDRPLVVEDDRLYLERYYRYEERFARMIEERVAAPVSALKPEVEEALERLFSEEGAEDSNLQRRAAERLLSGRLTMIAGGAGTGKTYTVAKMLVALAHQDGDLPPTVLCAPTGKAAARLESAVKADANVATIPPAGKEWLDNIQASTIHRLLGWERGRNRFAHNEQNPLRYELVIVDEMSMVPLSLAVKLLSALREESSLVLVGDPYQLESIEVGTVFADITGADEEGSSSNKIPIADRVVLLKKKYRFESEELSFIDFAEKVREGKADQAIEILGRGDDELRWIKDWNWSKPAGQMWKELLTQRRKVVELAKQSDGEGALEHLGEMAVLCAHRKRKGSVEYWEREIEKSLEIRANDLWYVGRPVMITSNDYNLELYNGDIGVVVAAGEDGPEVVFERLGPEKTFPPSSLGEHATVHAMTIHKSQGSEFNQVVVSLPPDSSRLLTRQLLYTAVTRAIERVTIIGDEDVISRAVERSVRRASGLRSKLWGPG